MKAIRAVVVVLILTAACRSTLAGSTALKPETEVAILTGRLHGETMALAEGPVYLLRGTFTVPAGTELRIEPGVTIKAEPGSTLVVEGKLAANGARKQHMIFRSATSATRSWHGIVLRRCEGAQLALVEIQDATDALVIESTPGVELTDCRFERNGTALRVGADSACVIKNCLIRGNKYGIVLDGGRIDVSASTLSSNREAGIESAGGIATISDSRVSNRGVSFKISGKSTFTVHNCSIESGRARSVLVATEAQQDFTRNWWGRMDTRTLQNAGTRANLPSVVDGLDQRGRGRALVVPFLARAPEPCGANLHEPLSDPPVEKLRTRKTRTFEQGTRIVFTTPSYVITDERFRDTFRKVLLADDAGEVAAYVQAGVAVKVTEDTFATVGARKDSMYWVRIIDGPHKGKQGLAWWQDIAEALAVDATDFIGKKFIWREDESKDWRTLRLSSVITFLEDGSTKEGFAPDRAWEVTPGGYLILMDSRYKTKRKITDRFTQARRENGRLILKGTSVFAHGDGTATLIESPGASEFRGPR